MSSTKPLDEFTKAYITCALWSSHDESRPDGGDPLDDNYTIDDIHEDSLASIVRVCEDFQQKHAALLAAADYGPSEWSTAARAGHDFWLTRNGHGAGFWDRGLGEIGTRLSEAATSYGACDLYVGDDRKLHVSTL